VTSAGGTARTIVKNIGDALALVRALRSDPRVPPRVKVVLGVAIANALSPIDLIPDFIPVIGQLDDALIIAGALRYARRHIPPEVFREHWRGDPRVLDFFL